MLATIWVTDADDYAPGGQPVLGSLRYAVSVANVLSPGPDLIRFSDDIVESGIQLTGGPLSITDRLLINGLSSDGALTVDIRGTSGTAFSFHDFSMTRVGQGDAVSGLRNVAVVGFDTAVELLRLTERSPESFFDIYQCVFYDNTVGVSIHTTDVVFRIESNIITGKQAASTPLGAGVSIFESNQTVIGAPVASFIGDFASGTRNLIGGFAHGVLVQRSFQPDLNISNNVFGYCIDLNTFEQVADPNGTGIALLFQDTDVRQIDHNVFAFGTGVSTNLLTMQADIVIESNSFYDVSTGVDIGPGKSGFAIRQNYFDGVSFAGVLARASNTSSPDFPSRVRVTSNSFFSIGPTALPIDLQERTPSLPYQVTSGPTVNDHNDIDIGVNALLNYPIVIENLISVANGKWRIPVSFDSQPKDGGASYRFEFYRYDAFSNSFEFVGFRDRFITKAEAGGDPDGVWFYEFDGDVFSFDDRIAVLAIETTPGLSDGNTSEMSLPTVLSLSGALPPSITDVRLDGSSWTGQDPHSFSAIADPLRPIFTQNVNTIEVVFSEHVLFGQNGTELQLIGSNGVAFGPGSYSFSFDVTTHTGRWTFASPLPADKYRIELAAASIRDTGNRSIDTEWTQTFGARFDDFVGDSHSVFPTGNGVSNSGLDRFRFFFSILPGDTNQNGVVAANDVTTPGDVNGDGNPSDSAIVAGLVGTSLPLRTNQGDYFDNDLVDLADYQLWRMTFGSTTDLRADGNSDGAVDAADYSVWADNLNRYSGWYTGPVPGAALPALFIPGVGPQVTGVTVSGSASLHDPYSFSSVVGSGDQLRTVPVGGADTISITFSEDVNVSAGDLDLVGLLTGNRPQLAEFSYDLLTMTASWRFIGWSLGDHYAITLSDAVTDVEGIPLDGEWTNPLSLTTTNPLVSTFPSGDGVSGGDFVFVATILPGDANIDGVVNSVDLSILGSHLGAVIDQLFEDGDFNGDGRVSISDLQHLSTNNNVNLTGALSILADLDGDFDVDEIDRDLLYANRNMANPTASDGDLDGDGDVDVADFDRLYEQFGLELAAVG